MKRYEDLLKSCGVEQYIITDETEESVELFFIKKKLDMRRIKSNEKISVTIYKTINEGANKFIGESDFTGDPSMTDEEWIAKIKAALYSAEFVHNKYYELPKGEKSDLVVAESDLMNYSLEEAANLFVKAVYEEDINPRSFINSFELFAVNRTVAIKGTNQSDVSYQKREINGEFVVQCKEPTDVETYQDFRFDTLNISEMKELVSRTISMTIDRAKATKMPKSGVTDVVLSHKYMSELMNFYKDRASVASIYPGYYENKLNENIQGDDVKGDVLNMKFSPVEPFSGCGIRMIERDFIKDGVLMTLHGSARFSYYLNVPAIGYYGKVVLPSGDVSFEDLLKRKCLHIVNFSDFQMDSDTGHFKGEIRLAYCYNEDGSRTIVTGGSINGSIFEAQKEFIFSKECQNLPYYSGPKAVLLKNVPVAGE